MCDRTESKECDRQGRRDLGKCNKDRQGKCNKDLDLDKCDDLCDSRNEYVDSFCCSSCNMARIKLELKTVNGRVVFRVTNTGTVNLCNDIFVCSYYFGKLKIDNELLLPNEYVESGEQEYKLSDKNRNQKHDDYEKEKARAYTKVAKKKFVYSNEVKQYINLGVYLAPGMLYDTLGTEGAIYCTVANSFVSTEAAKNVVVRMLITKAIDQRLVSYTSPYNDFSVVREGNYLIASVKELPIGEVRTFVVKYDQTAKVNDKDMLYFSLEIESDNPGLAHTVNLNPVYPIMI